MLDAQLGRRVGFISMYGVGLNLLPVADLARCECGCENARPRGRSSTKTGTPASGHSLLLTKRTGISLARPSGVWNLPSVYRRGLPEILALEHVETSHRADFCLVQTDLRFAVGHWMPRAA